MPFSPIRMESLLAWLDSQIAQRQAAYVCAVNTSCLVQASRDAAFLQALREADMNVPDGAPVAWAVGRLGRTSQPRLDGPSVMTAALSRAQARNYRVLLYGSSEEVLRRLRRRLAAHYPDLAVADAISPPFRPLTRSEDTAMSQRIRNAAPDMILVGLGAPKQEIWMHEHRDAFDAVMIGVGAAFDFHAGVIKRAPPSLQGLGLEWAYRLAQEPRRLWRRYATTLPEFVVRLACQLALQHQRRL